MLFGAASFCVAGAALGASPARLAWQAQHSGHIGFVFRGRLSTWSTFMAGAASGAPQARFAWQVQHLEHLRLGLTTSRCSTGSISVAYCRAFFTAQTIHTPPSTLHHQTHHHQDNTISTTSSTQSHQHNLINTSPSTQHHLHNTIYTTSSTQHHLHNIIKHNIINTHHLHYISNTTSSTQHHKHITIYTTPSTQLTTPSTPTPHHQTLAGAALGTLPSYPFCLIPANFPFCFSSVWIVLCFCFVDLFHSWMSEDIVNMWGYPALYFFDICSRVCLANIMLRGVVRASKCPNGSCRHLCNWKFKFQLALKFEIHTGLKSSKPWLFQPMSSGPG